MFINKINKGINKGKDNIGNNVFLVLALDTIADIIVEAAAIPILPNNKFITKDRTEFKLSVSIKRKYRIVVKIFKQIDNIILKMSFPKYMAVGLVESLRKRDVCLSSSLMKILDKPVIAPKKITTQKIPEEISGVKSSFINEKTSIVTVVRMKRRTDEIE